MALYSNALTAMRLFKADSRFYIFVLLYTDGHTKTRLLGITDAVYRNRDEAKGWRDEIVRILRCAAPGRDVTKQMIKDAEEVLDKLYREITFVS